jgi:DMSO reductase anchor subunit
VPDKFVPLNAKRLYVLLYLAKKLATAAASVLYTWNTAINLVNSRTSLNFLLRFVMVGAALLTVLAAYAYGRKVYARRLLRIESRDSD